MPSYAFRPLTRRCRILDTLVAMLYGRYALSWVIGCLPIEVTGQLSVVNGLDVEKTIEADYDRWVRPPTCQMQLAHIISFQPCSQA